MKNLSKKVGLKGPMEILPGFEGNESLYCRIGTFTGH